ncbi:MAG: aminoacyl-histidine dipeptidase [Candidatus Aminicenantales bacterium]
MSYQFSELKPSHLWKHFEQILIIPHCSGNEKGLADYIISQAKRLNLVWKKDPVGNVVVSKKATTGHENAETVILQGHLDMVCEKNSDIIHDFTKDSIESEIREGWVCAKGTTLGSDNGVGLSASLAIMEDNSLIHGPLEFLFTVDEETGLTGARRLTVDFLKGKRLINLDSEDEGTFTIGCAGGADSEIIIPIKRKKSKSRNAFRLKLLGLRGGHSGLDINKGRGNAIKLLARILWQVRKEIPYELLLIEGGSKRNAIPREAWADVLVDTSKVKSLMSLINEAFIKVQAEYKTVERDLQYSCEPVSNKKGEALSQTSQEILINFLFTCPHGVLSMHPEIEGLVETSTNLAIVRSKKDRAQVFCNSRSSINSALEATRNMIRGLAGLGGAKIRQPEGYPGWAPNLQSSLLKILKEVYHKVFNKEPEIVAIHAGLECGIIDEKFHGMDMISIGPTIKYPHSPEEKVEIASVEKFWKFLTVLLAELA